VHCVFVSRKDVKVLVCQAILLLIKLPKLAGASFNIFKSSIVIEFERLQFAVIINIFKLKL